MPVPSEEFEPTSPSMTFLAHGHGFVAPMHPPSAGLHFNYAYVPRHESLPMFDSDPSAMHSFTAPTVNDRGMAFRTQNDINMLNLRDQFLSPATVPKPSVGIGMNLGLATASEMFDRFDTDRNGSLPVEELMSCAEALWKALHYGGGDLPLQTRYTLQKAMEEKIVAPGASFVEFAEFVAWYEECVERITPPPSQPVASPPLQPMQPQSDPLPAWGSMDGLPSYGSVLRPGSWGPPAGESPYGIPSMYGDGASYPPNSARGDPDGASSLHSWQAMSQALPPADPPSQYAPPQTHYGDPQQQQQQQHQQQTTTTFRTYYQDPTTGQLVPSSEPSVGQPGVGQPALYSTGDGLGQYATGDGPQGVAGVTASQLQQGKLVYVPNPHNPAGPPQLVLQIPATASADPYQPPSALSPQHDPAEAPLTPTRPEPASPGSPPSVDTTPQPVQSIQTQTSPPQPPPLLHFAPPVQHSSSSNALPPISSAPGVAPAPYPPASPPQPAPPVSSGVPPPQVSAQTGNVPVPGPQSSFPSVPASTPAEETFLCDFQCGFSGSFDAVSMHEGNCVFNPANGGAGAGLAQGAGPGGMAQPAYSKRMRLSQQVTPMTPVMEGGEDEAEDGPSKDPDE